MCRNPKEESRQIGVSPCAVKVARTAAGGGKPVDMLSISQELPITTKYLPCVCFLVAQGWYTYNCDTIIGNCDTTLFLGGKEKTTLKEMSEMLGKETINMMNTGESRGQSASYSMNLQTLGKELMSMDEIAVMDGAKCILQVRGVRPFLSVKYDIEKHPNYKYLADSDPKQVFNIAEFVKVFKDNKAKLLEGLNKKNTQHILIEINDDDDAADTPETAPIIAPTVKITPNEQANTQIIPENLHIETVKTPIIQNDIQTENYEDGDDDNDSDDFDPDDTEIV